MPNHPPHDPRSDGKGRRIRESDRLLDFREGRLRARADGRGLGHAPLFHSLRRLAGTARPAAGGLSHSCESRTSVSRPFVIR